VTTTKSQKVELGKVKETKNTVRYDTDEDGAVLTNVYLSKDAAGKLGNPDKISVEVRAA
jgi:hypothetical protein